MIEDTAAIGSRAIGLRPNRCAANDRAKERFERLFEEHAADVGRFLHQIVRDRWEAEDLLQETFATAWREYSTLSAHANPRTWLFGVARNRALVSLRGGRRRARALARLSGCARHQDDRSDAVATRDFLVRHLDPDDRALVVLHYVHGFSSSELAEVMGLNPPAVRQRVSRARRRLAAALDADEPTRTERGDR